MMFVFTYNTFTHYRYIVTILLDSLYETAIFKEKVTSFFFVSVSLPLECSCERWINLDKGVKPLGTISRFCRDNRVQVFINFFSLSFV